MLLRDSGCHSAARGVELTTPCPLPCPPPLPETSEDDGRYHILWKIGRNCRSFAFASGICFPQPHAGVSPPHKGSSQEGSLLLLSCMIPLRNSSTHPSPSHPLPFSIFHTAIHAFVQPSCSLHFPVLGWCVHPSIVSRPCTPCLLTFVLCCCTLLVWSRHHLAHHAQEDIATSAWKPQANPEEYATHQGQPSCSSGTCVLHSYRRGGHGGGCGSGGLAGGHHT